MYYSEQLKNALTATNVKLIYGVNPVAEPDRAALIGVYPVTPVPDGFAVSHYSKEENNTYTAVPHCVSLEEQRMVKTVRQMETTLSELRQSLGLPAVAETPIDVNGYYPLYTSEAEANFVSPDDQSVQQVLNGTTYYMPNAGETFLGDYLT